MLLFLNPRGTFKCCIRFNGKSTVCWRTNAAFEASWRSNRKEAFVEAFSNRMEKWVTNSERIVFLCSSIARLHFNSESCLRAEVYWSSVLSSPPFVLFAAKYHRSISVHASSSRVQSRLKIPRDKWSPGKQTYGE